MGPGFVPTPCLLSQPVILLRCPPSRPKPWSETGLMVFDPHLLIVLLYGCIVICSSFYHFFMLRLYTIYNFGFVTWYAWRPPSIGQQHKLTRRLASYSTGNPYNVSAWPVYRGQIHSLWLGDVIDSGIGLSYRTASLCSMGGGGLYDNPMLKSTFSPLVRD